MLEFIKALVKDVRSKKSVKQIISQNVDVSLVKLFDDLWKISQGMMTCSFVTQLPTFLFPRQAC